MAGRSPAEALQRSDERRPTPATVAEWLASLGQIADLVNSGTQLPDVLQRIAFAVCQHSDWSTSAIMAVDEASGFAIQIARHDPILENETLVIDVGEEKIERGQPLLQAAVDLCPFISR